VAFFALLLSGQWSVLWQWVVIGLVILGMRGVGNLNLKSSQEEIDQHSEPASAAAPAIIDKEQSPESSPQKSLPDSLEQAAWEKFQTSPFAKNLYLSSYSYAVLAHAYQMVKKILYDSNVRAWHDVGLSPNEDKVRALGAYFGFLLAQSMTKNLRSEEPSMLALRRDTALVTDLLFGDQVEAKLAAEADTKRMASDMQDALHSLQIGSVIAPTIDALLGTGLGSSTDPSGFEKSRVAGESFSFHKENVPKSLQWAADKMK